MSDLTAEARVQAHKYWYSDGLAEITVGIIVLLQTGNTLLLRVCKSQWFWPVEWIYLILFLTYAIFSPRIVTAVRERFTFPRIGYAEPPESVRKIRIATVLTTLLIILGMVVVVRHGWNADWLDQNLPVAGGLVYSLIGAYTALRYGMLRHLFVGLFSVLLGVAIDIEYPTFLGRNMWFVALGCALLFAGGFTFWKFVRTTPTSLGVK